MARILQAWHADLNDGQLSGLRRLFDAEYLTDFGEWDADAPYGYSPAELHTIGVTNDGEIVGHISTQRRPIYVGDQQVTIAGTGGVLVSPGQRGTGLGRRMMAAAQQANCTIAPADFGYLGCREEVVPFYLSCGYNHVYATERCLSRLDQATIVESADDPLLICSGTRGTDAWPVGIIDLRGTPW